MTFTDKGVVLREVQVGESDKILTVLLNERGKTSLSVKGAKKALGKLSALSQPFSLSEFEILESGGKRGANKFLIVTGGSLIDSFYGVREDFERFCQASFFCEMTDRLIYPEMESRGALSLLTRALRALSRGLTEPLIVSAAFQFAFLKDEGYAPHLDGCRVCGAEIDSGAFDGGGLVCLDCARGLKGGRALITKDALAAARYILSRDGAAVFGFTLPESDAKSLYGAAALFRESHVEERFRSLELLI